MENQKNDNRHLLIVSLHSCVDFPPQLRGLSSTHNTKIRIKIYNLYMCGLIYIDVVTNLHSQEKKLIRGRMYANKSHISFFDLRTKNKILFERKRVPFSFYIFIFNLYFFIFFIIRIIQQRMYGNTATDVRRI